MSVMRWFGVFFDRKFLFKKHVETMATRVLSTISGLRILVNSIRGLSDLNARLVYKTVVLAVLVLPLQFGSRVSDSNPLLSHWNVPKVSLRDFADSSVLFAYP